jgi:4'-phosphopantetheinyl transferase
MLEGAPPWFDFSFSRCVGLHVCVVGAHRRIGVDVEAFGDGVQTRPMALADCSARDRVWIAGQPGPRQREALTEIWTKKEAFVKGIGMGVETSLALVEVPHGEDGLVGLVAAQSGQRPWLVRTFTPHPGVIGAVAAEGQWRLTLLRYPEP